jgi:hypothetical protein
VELMKNHLTKFHVIASILILIFTGSIAIPSAFAEDDDEPSTGSASASADNSIWIYALFLLCFIGMAFGVRGLLDKKEKAKVFYAMLAIVSLISIIFIYGVFITSDFLR